MPSTRPDGALDIELLTTGPNAYGYGQLADRRNFAFRVRNRKARLEIYRADTDSAEPAQADVELVAERSTGSISLDSPRSLRALVRNLVVEADTAPDATEPDSGVEEPEERTLRAYFVRLDSIMDSWNDPETDAAPVTPVTAAVLSAGTIDSATVVAGPRPAAPTRRTLRDYLRRRAA